MSTLTTPDLEALGATGDQLRRWRGRGVIEGEEDHPMGQRGNAPMRYPPGTDDAVLYLRTAVESGQSIDQAGFEAWLVEHQTIPLGFVRDLLVGLAKGGYRRWRRDVLRGSDLASTAKDLASKVEARKTRHARDPLVRAAFRNAGSKTDYEAALLQLLPEMVIADEPGPGGSDPMPTEPFERVFGVKVGRNRISAWRGLRLARGAGLLPLHRMSGTIAALSDNDLLAARQLFDANRKSLERLLGLFGSFFDRWETRAGLFALTGVLLAHTPPRFRPRVCEPVEFQL